MHIDSVIRANRETLETVESFIDDADYYGSPDNYGLPQHVRHLIDLPVNHQITYVDLMMYLQTHFSTKNIKYVEIGVSVLKTFYQACHFLEDSELYAFDINKINPTIAKKFDLVSVEDQLSQYTCGSNKVSHYRGDVFSTEDLNNFKEHIGSKVNIIFSDACHTSLGLASEYLNFIKDALDDEFILYYDDLGNEAMRNVFIDIVKELKEKNANTSAAFVEVNGWLGQHEHQHLNGIITSLDFEKIINDNQISIPVGLFQKETQ